MKQDEIRLRLIDGTIHVIAKDGLDKASTKQIGIATSTNEAYIYRCFVDKEDLLTKVFDALDEELLTKTMQFIEVMYVPEIDFEIRCRLYFSSITSYLHLPLQSGSTRILKEMNRRYTKEQYLELADKIRREMPDIALTTDIIVGFPGETAEDVEETIDVIKHVKYENAFTFIYLNR